MQNTYGTPAYGHAPYSDLSGTTTEEGISLSELFHIFRKRLGWFFLGFVIVVCCSVAYLLLATPNYEVETAVAVKAGTGASSLDEMMEGTVEKDQVTTEMKLLSSMSNIKAVLSSLDLSQYTDRSGQPYTEASLLKTLPDNIELTSVSNTALIQVTVTDPNPRFATDFANALVADHDHLYGDIVVESRDAQRRFLETRISRNEEQLQQASAALGRFWEDNDELKNADLGVLLQNQQQFSRFRLSASQLQEEGAPVYMDLADTATPSSDLLAYYRLRLEPLQLEQREARIFIDTYDGRMTASGISPAVSLDAMKEDREVEDLLARLHDLRRELVMYDSLSAMPAAPSEEGATRASSLDDTIERTAQALRQRIVVLAEGYGNDQYVDSVVRVLTTGAYISVLEERERDFTDTMARLPELERRLYALQRDVLVHENLGMRLQNMLEEVKLFDAEQNDGSLVVVDQAVIPLEPTSPNKLLILAVGLLLGCAVGLLLALAMEFMDPTIKGEGDIAKLTDSEIPFLAWLPLMRPEKMARHPSLPVLDDPLSDISDRFKVLASKLDDKQSGKGIFAVTSCGAAEGKSTVAANIALSLVQGGWKVLLIDGSLQEPGLASFFGLHRHAAGLVDVVLQDTPLEEVLLHPFPSVPNLHLLVPGTAPDASVSLFSRNSWTSLVSRLRSLYDFVIIDIPAQHAVNTLVSVGRSVDGLLLVVRAGITRREDFSELLRNFRTGDVPFAGVVLNGCLPASGTGSHGYGWYRKKYARDLRQRRSPIPSLSRPILVHGKGKVG